MVGTASLIGGSYIWTRWLNRREFRRQFAADRTIHVEQKQPLTVGAKFALLGSFAFIGLTLLIVFTTR